MLSAEHKKFYRLIVVDQHQYFDGHVQVECSFSYGIPGCYNKNFKISEALKMLSVKQNNELSLCETGNFTKLYEHD